MLVTNQTTSDIYFGPLHLAAGVGQTLTVDDTSATSLYLTKDSVADALNDAYAAGRIAVSGQMQPFPRPTGVPQLLHGDGNPEGLVFAAQGSLYMRRDGVGFNSLYVKTTGVTLSTGWQPFNAVGNSGIIYRKTTAKTVSNTVTETDLLNGEITVAANVLASNVMLRLTARGDWIQNQTDLGVAYPRFKLKLGATTLIDTGAGPSNVRQSSSRFGWSVDATVANLGATNSQWVAFNAGLVVWTNASNGATSFTTGEGALSIIGGTTTGFLGEAVYTGGNSGAVDTTASLALVLSVILPTAGTCDIVLKHALVELI